MKRCYQCQMLIAGDASFFHLTLNEEKKKLGVGPSFDMLYFHPRCFDMFQEYTYPKKMRARK